MTRVYTCDDCDTEYATVQDLDRHVKKTGHKNFGIFFGPMHKLLKGFEY